ncbi:hypothetical protein [Mycobacterium sp. URHB0021]
MLTAAVEAAHQDIIAGYRQLYGGYDLKNRAAANRAGWSRIDNFGQAFMTALANGQLPFPLPEAHPTMPFGIPGATPSPVPLQIPALNPPAPSLLSLPGI